MVQCADALVWELVKNNTSFMRKTNGRTKRSGSIRFSVEKGNLASKSSFKYSGLANSKAVDVSSTAANGAVLSVKTQKASTQVKKGQAATPLNKNFRRVEHILKSQAIDNYYRPDLKKEALAKYSQVYRSNRVAKGVKKAVPVKRGRSS